MKNKNSLPLFLASAALIFFIAFSCSKSTGASSSAITKENIAGTYVLTAATVSFPPLPPQSILDSIPACQRDDQYELKPDLTLIYIDAGTKCVPPGDKTSTWSLSGNTITIDSVQATIQSFNGRVLVVNVPVTFSGISTTTTETLTKQ